jgi:hypothetical protein
MPRLALFNLTFGFCVLFLAASAGAFIADDLTTAYLKDRAMLETWAMTLTKSAHGHTNLFALIHIAFGLTMAYSALPARIKLLQTIGLGLGTLAMAVLMLVRARLGPTEDLDVVGIVIGVLLSCALAALASHAAGLAAKLLKRA